MIELNQEQAESAEDQAVKDHAFIAVVKPGKYVVGAPGSADRLRAAHVAARCKTHWPAGCTCDGRRL